MKTYTITSDAWKQEAWDSAIKRRNYHAALGSKRHWSDPDKGEYTDEYYGSLAQIVFREHLIKIGLEEASEFSPLYTDNLSSMPAWDAKVLGRTIDVKSVPPDTHVQRKRMLIKVSEYKGLDAYVPVKFWNENDYSFCGMASKKEVDNAPVKNFGYENAYWFFLDQLRPLQFTINGERVEL